MRKKYPGNQCFGVEYDFALVNKAKQRIASSACHGAAAASSASRPKQLLGKSDTVSTVTSNSSPGPYGDISNGGPALPNAASFTHENTTVLHADATSEDAQQIYDYCSKFFVYLVPEGLKQIEPALLRAKERDPESVRIVSYVFKLPNLEPKRTEVFKGATKVYFY